MKVLFYLLSFTVCTVFAGPVELVGGKYPRLFEYQDEEGVIHKVDLLEPIDMDLLEEIERNPAYNEYHLFTRRNPRIHQRLIMNNASSITSSNFNPNHRTIVVAHGWLSNQKTNPNPVIRDACLNNGETNVIIIDWRRLAMSSYPTAVRGVPVVGRGLGQFLNFLNRVNGARFNTMHLIGFGLGSHLVGNAGREINGTAARVTGLDPAGPLWNENDHRIRSTDGVYVEAIHTTTSNSGFGIGSPVANADFFPNGGRSQPGCFTRICDHNRAWEFFASTVTRNNLIGRQCNNMEEVRSNNCNGPSLHMGNTYLNKKGSGLFRVNIRGWTQHPFNGY